MTIMQASPTTFFIDFAQPVSHAVSATGPVLTLLWTRSLLLISKIGTSQKIKATMASEDTLICALLCQNIWWYGLIDSATHSSNWPLWQLVKANINSVEKNVDKQDNWFPIYQNHLAAKQRIHGRTPVLCSPSPEKSSRPRCPWIWSK